MTTERGTRPHPRTLTDAVTLFEELGQQADLDERVHGRHWRRFQDFAFQHALPISHRSLLTFLEAQEPGLPSDVVAELARLVAVR